MLALTALVLCHILAITTSDITDGTELVMAFLVHRHGDRTPTESSLKYSTDPQTLVELSKPYGYGQLTDVGKRRAYKLGKFIRNRYDELLGKQHNESNVYIRSTDLTRTKMTILSALAAIYPPELMRWSQILDWTPVPYTTVPPKYDYNLAYLNCPEFISASDAAFDTYYPEFADYIEVLQAETMATGQNIVENPINSYTVNDVIDVQISLGIPLPSYIYNLLPEIREAAALALDFVFEGENAALEAGVLLEEFFEKSSLAIAGNNTEKIRIYSAHDYNVYAFEIVTHVAPRQGVPKYASAYALELRRVRRTGQFVVLPVYLPQPGEDLVYLKVKGCSQLCDYDSFVNITKINALDYKTWQDQCGFTEDFVVDLSE